jgi:hypothetical protein
VDLESGRRGPSLSVSAAPAGAPDSRSDFFTRVGFSPRSLGRRHDRDRRPPLGAFVHRSEPGIFRGARARGWDGDATETWAAFPRVDYAVLWPRYAAGECYRHEESLSKVAFTADGRSRYDASDDGEVRNVALSSEAGDASHVLYGRQRRVASCSRCRSDGALRRR